MGSELHEEMGLWSLKEGWETSINFPVAGSYRALGLDLQGASPEQAARLKQQLEATKAKLESADDVQLATLTKHQLVGDLLYGTVFNYFALNDLQDQIAAQSAGILNYRLPSYGTFSTDLNTQYWYGIPRNVTFAGLSMDIDHIKNQRNAKNNDTQESISFSQSIGARMSAMEHLVPEQMFSTESSKAQGISAVKALAIASQQGQKIWKVTKNNLDTALSKTNLSIDEVADIRNAVNSGKFATIHESIINYNGWVGAGYILEDPNTGGAAYMISGGYNGSNTNGGQSNQIAMASVFPVSIFEKLPSIYDVIGFYMALYECSIILQGADMNKLIGFAIKYVLAWLTITLFAAAVGALIAAPFFAFAAFPYLALFWSVIFGLWLTALLPQPECK